MSCLDFQANFLPNSKMFGRQPFGSAYFWKDEDDFLAHKKCKKLKNIVSLWVRAYCKEEFEAFSLG